MVGDLETPTGYICEIEGGSMFMASYCLIFNFHPKLEMTPLTCFRSFRQNNLELKFITVPEKFYPYIDHDDLRCFEDVCNTVLEKNKEAGHLQTLYDGNVGGIQMSQELLRQRCEN